MGRIFYICNICNAVVYLLGWAFSWQDYGPTGWHVITKSQVEVTARRVYSSVFTWVDHHVDFVTLTYRTLVGVWYFEATTLSLPPVHHHNNHPFINPLMSTLKLHSNRLLYSNTVIGTLRPLMGGLFQMQQPTHQRPVYQLHIDVAL